MAEREGADRDLLGGGAGEAHTCEEPSRDLIDHLAVAVVVYDEERRVTHANPSAVRMGGLPRESWLGRRDEELWPERITGQCLPHLARAYESGEAQRLELSVTQDGSTRILAIEYDPISGPGGSVRRVIAVAQDVTEQRRVEAALRESEELYRSIFTLAPSGVVVNDDTGRILAFNDQAHEQLGYTRDEFGALTLADLDADERPDDVRGHIQRIAQANGDEYEVHHRARSGEVRDVLVRTRPVRLGGVTRFLNVWQDITDRKRAEAAVRDSDQRKSEFLGVLSHELRNPLAPIRNSLYLLERAPAGGEAAARAREVLRRQTEHLTRLVDDLLDVTRVSRGKIELQRARVDVRDVVRRTCDDHRSIFDQRGVALRLDVPADPVWIDADATRISQVVGNLLQNAAKFTPRAGAVSVDVSAGEGRAELRVRDTGVGIEPGQVERMFEPFAQAERSLARTQGGLGLGLALVRGLAELHGGTARARSAGPGSGAEFVVTLPLATPPLALAAATAPAGAGTGRLVLVVEDNLDAGQSLADVLELSGHTIRIARDGRSGIAMARELRPDVVLCDIGLPDVSGYDVARTLRGDPALGHTRLIALSGYAQPEDRARAVEAGFEAHLPKPPPLERLEALLDAPPSRSP